MATSNTITVKFRASGDQALQKAIAELHLAQTRLKKGTGAYSRAVRRLKLDKEKLSREFGLATKNNRLLSNSFATLRSKMLLVSFGAGVVGSSVGRLVKMYGEQEKAQRLLAKQLGGNSKRLLDFASAQQKVTTFGDEVTISAMATAAAFTKNEDQIEKLTKVAMDYAIFSGKDLNQAVQDVSKSVFSSTNLLSRQGIAFTGVVGSAERFNNAMDAIAEKTGGLAEEEATTLLGSLDQMANAVGDLGENIGSIFVPIVNLMTKAIKAVAEAFNVSRVKSYAAAITALGTAYALSTVSVNKFKKAILGLNTFMLKNKRTLFFGLMAIGIAEVVHRLGIFEEVLDKFGGTQKKVNGLTEQQIRENAKLAVLKQKEFYLKDGEITQLQELQLLQIEKVALQPLIDKGIIQEAELLQMLMGIREKEIEIEEETSRKKIENITKLVNAAQQMGDSFQTLFDADQSRLEANIEKERDREKEQAKNIRSKIARKKAEEAIDAKFDQKQKQREADAMQRRKALKIWKMSSAISNVALGITQTWRDETLPTWGKVAMTAMQAAAGGAQIATINAQEYGAGGLVGGRLHSQGGTPIIAERGEFVMSRNATEAIGIENLNRMNQGGSGAINISFAGNVMSEDFIENEAIPKIKRAIRRGADIGVG